MASNHELELRPELLAVCRLPAGYPLPIWLKGAVFWSAIYTPDETSLICPQEKVPPEYQASRGWRALGVKSPREPDQAGVLAELAGLLAAAGVSVLALSTYDTDYILLPDQDLAKAQEALQSGGHLVQA